VLALTSEGIGSRRRDRQSDRMHHFQVHTIESAPDQSKAALEGLNKTFGLVPNLAATMAESPTLVNGFVGALVNFIGGSFTGAQRQVILLTSAVTNSCAWAVAFHSTAALGEGVPATDVEAIRAGRLPADAKTAALSALARALLVKRGALDADDRGAFEAAGFTPAQTLEVIAGLAASMMANYAGNITNPPLEEPFRAQAWKR
jgi:AhpD family alkylhydroperoxidase